MKKKTVVTLWMIFMLLGISISYATEEFDGNPDGDKIIVNQENNTITFVYDETDLDLMNEWNALRRFDDVPGDAKNQAYISYVTQVGIMDSIDSQTFEPDRAITVKELKNALSNTLKEETYDKITNFFSDEQLVCSETDSKRDKNEILQFLSDDEESKSGESISLGEAESLLSDIAVLENNDLFLDYQDGEDTGMEKPSLDIMAAINGTLNDKSVDLTRGDTARLLTTYQILRDKPTMIIPGSCPIEYIEESDDDMIVNDETFSCYNEEDDILLPNWCGMTNPNTHKKITQSGMNIFLKEKNNSISNLNGKFSSRAQSYILKGCVQPDFDAQNHANGEYFSYHYCSPQLKNGTGKTAVSGYTRMNDNYYLAKVYFFSQDYTGAYEKLGRAMHYMEDINSPPHAAIIRGETHKRYEKWVQQIWNNSYNATSASDATYSFMCTSTFKNMALTFAKNASSAQYCVYNWSTDPKKSRELTRDCLLRTQRAVAGLSYRYIVDTGRLN